MASRPVKHRNTMKQQCKTMLSSVYHLHALCEKTTHSCMSTSFSRADPGVAIFDGTPNILAGFCSGLPVPRVEGTLKHALQSMYRHG